MRRTPSKRACAASSCDGVTASFLTGHRSKVCTGAQEKNGNKPFWLVAYSHFKQGREPRRQDLGFELYDLGFWL
jgi:hypothetical protein